MSQHSFLYNFFVMLIVSVYHSLCMVPLTGHVIIQFFLDEQLLEVALSQLLEARHIMFSSTTVFGAYDPSGQDCLKPSDKVFSNFIQKLQNLLRIMLAAVQNFQKASSHKSLTAQTKNHGSIDGSNKREAQRLGQVGDAVKLKEMYRIALKSAETPDLKQMHSIWLS